MRFKGKVALVTGAGHGIGHATALRFAQEGATVVVADLDAAAAQAVADEISALGHNALGIRVDVADEHDCERMAAMTIAQFGRLDIVFANAGISADAPILELTVDQWDRVLGVNLRGVFLTCKSCIPALKIAGGAIVTMSSSMAGWDTSAMGAAYMASKEGVAGLTRSLALQLGGYGIRVNAVCPGVIRTGLGVDTDTSAPVQDAHFERFARRTPLRRVGDPEDVAAVVAFLASNDARHMTGSLLLIDGGQTLQSWSNAPDAESYPLDGRS